MSKLNYRSIELKKSGTSSEINPEIMEELRLLAASGSKVFLVYTMGEIGGRTKHRHAEYAADVLQFGVVEMIHELGGAVVGLMRSEPYLGRYSDEDINNEIGA